MRICRKTNSGIYPWNRVLYGLLLTSYIPHNRVKIQVPLHCLARNAGIFPRFHLHHKQLRFYHLEIQLGPEKPKFIIYKSYIEKGQIMSIMTVKLVYLQGVSKIRYLSHFCSRGRILPFNMCFGIRISSPFHLATQTISIHNLNCPENANCRNLFAN